MAQTTLSQAVRKAGFGGWDFDEPVEVMEWVPGSLPTDPRTQKGTGVWQVNVTDPTGRYNEVIKLRKAPHEPGTGQAGPGGGWIVAEAPNLPKPTADTTAATKHTDPWGGLYTINAAGEWETQVEGDIGKYRTGQAEAAMIEAKWNEIQANNQAGRGLLTNDQWERLQLDIRAGTLNRDTLNQRKTEYEQKNALDKKTEQRLLDQSRAEIGNIEARTAGVGVETRMNEQRLKSLIESAPDEATARRLSNELAELQQAEIKRKAKQPTIQDLGQGATYGVMGPEGNIEERFRQGYVPKTLGEVAARRGQLDALARAKGQEFTSKVSGTYTQENALADFNKWYDTNIGPQIPALEAATEEAQYARGKDIAASRQASLTSALGAGTQAISAFNASSGQGIDPEFGKLLAASAAGKRPEGIDYSKMFAGGGMGDQAKQATAEALKWIDRDAARMTGQPDPTWMQQNPGQVLDRTQYMSQAPPPAAAPAPVGAAAAAPSPEQVGAGAAIDPWAAFQERRMADIALQQRQAQVPFPGPPVGEGPMPGPVPEAFVAPYQPQPQWRPPRRPVPLPSPVGNMDVDFPPGSLPIPAYMQAPEPVYDPAAEGYPVPPSWPPAYQRRGRPY